MSMTAKDAREAVKAAKIILAYVVLNSDSGFRMKVSKLDVLASLEGIDDDAEVEFQWGLAEHNWSEGTLLII